MLAPWSLRFRRFKKRLAWVLYQRRDLLSARVLHATSMDEAQVFRSLGFTQPIAVIPNGISKPPDHGTTGLRDHGTTGPLDYTSTGPRDTTTTGPEDKRTTEHGPVVPWSRGPVVLFLSRIHPKKGLLDLVEAWAAVRPVGWRVVVAGGDENGHRAEVERAVLDKGIADRFEFVGEVADDKKWELYSQAGLFVLPSKAENFGLVIAEALTCGVPVITTRATPWAELQTHRCGWWVETGPAPLADALQQATRLTNAEREQMGRRGRALVEENYTWPAAAQKMLAVYQWMLGLEEKPLCVV
jgi:glycosyltransferase involved in cell wall biosynthesis